MKARVLQIVAPGDARWEEHPIPDPGPGEVLLEVEAVATCPHWDIRIMSGEPMFAEKPQDYPYFPGGPGHEVVGRIAEVRDLGSNSGLSVGMRVAAWRAEDRPFQCYAEYTTLRAENVLPVPDDLPAQAVTSLELAMCVQVSFDQLTEVKALSGRRVAIAGLGASGLLAVQLARAHGASEVVGIDPLPDRRALALELGATAVRDPQELPETDRFGDDAFHSALDTSGLAASIEALMPITRRAVAMFGVLRGEVRFGPQHWYGGFSLIGYGEHNRGAAQRALEHITNGRLRLAPLITHRRTLDRYAEAVDLLRSKQAVKVLFDVHPRVPASDAHAKSKEP